MDGVSQYSAGRVLFLGHRGRVLSQNSDGRMLSYYACIQMVLYDSKDRCLPGTLGASVSLRYRSIGGFPERLCLNTVF